MRKVTRMILLIFGVLCAIVSVYFILAIVGNSDEIISAYENMTSQSAVNVSLKTRFISTYTVLTGDKTLMLVAGLDESDIGIEVGDTGLSVTPDEEAEPLPNNPPPTPVVGDKDKTGLNYQPISTENGLRYQDQSGPYWDYAIHNKKSMADNGCAIYALYAAALNLGCPGVTGTPGGQLEDFVMEACGNLVVNSQGYLDGDCGDKGYGGELFLNLVPKLGINVDAGSYDGSYPTEDGTYIVYYKHPTGSESHWVYLELSGGNAKVCCTSEEDTWEEIKSCKINHWHKVWK